MDMQPTPNDTPTDAEFASFLVESQDDALMKELNAEKLLRIKDAITAGLNAFEVPYIVDASDTLNEPQVDALFETILTNLSEENGFIDHEKAESTLDSTILKQSATEHALYAKISLYNTAFSEQSSLEQTTLLSASKASIIAEWVIDQDLTADSPWVAFLNATMLGDALTEAELNQAMLEVLDQKEQKEATALQIELARSVARITSGIETLLQEDPEDEFELFRLAMLAPHLEAPEFASQTDAIARALNISTDSVRCYVETILENMPGEASV